MEATGERETQNGIFSIGGVRTHECVSTVVSCSDRNNGGRAVFLRKKESSESSGEVI